MYGVAFLQKMSSPSRLSRCRTYIQYSCYHSIVSILHSTTNLDHSPRIIRSGRPRFDPCANEPLSLPASPTTSKPVQLQRLRQPLHHGLLVVAALHTRKDRNALQHATHDFCQSRACVENGLRLDVGCEGVVVGKGGVMVGEGGAVGEGGLGCGGGRG